MNIENDLSGCVYVTNLIEKFQQPYDKDFWSAYVALERLIPKDSWQIEKKSLLSEKKFHKEILDVYDISENDFNREQQNILDEWEENNRKACDRGIEMHKQMENLCKSGKDINLSKFGIGGKFIYNEDQMELTEGVNPEFRISVDLGDYELVGKPDLTVKQNNSFVIVDYKFNKEIKSKSYFDSQTKTSQKMKYPLNNLDDCNFNHYSLQLSLYAWMIKQKFPDATIEDLILYHVDPKGKEQILHCEYLLNDVERLLQFYRKQAILDKRKQLRKPIDY